MGWLGWFGVVLALGSALSLWGHAGSQERQRERAGWPTTTGRITDRKVGRIDDGSGRAVQVYVEYKNDEGVIIGFWNLRTVSDRTPFGGKVDIRINPDNRYEGEIISKPFAAVPPSAGSWWGAAALLVVGVALVVLAFIQ